MIRLNPFKNSRIIAIFFILFCFSLFLSSCFSSKNIIGRWVVTQIKTPNSNSVNPNQWITFAKNGKLYGGDMLSDTSKTGNWSLNKKSKTLTLKRDNSSKVDSLKITQISKNEAMLKFKENEFVKLKKLK